jgi:hypothetical protein
LLARRVVDLLGYTLIFNRELELVRLNSRRGVLGVIAGLNHLAFVGLEDEPFLLEVVEVAGIDACAVDEEEAEEDEHREGDNHYG